MEVSAVVLLAWPRDSPADIQHILHTTCENCSENPDNRNGPWDGVVTHSYDGLNAVTEPEKSGVYIVLFILFSEEKGGRERWEMVQADVGWPVQECGWGHWILAGVM